MEIPAGPFTMGSDPQRDSNAYGDEQPAHSLDLPGFYMARYPVTVTQFRAFAEDEETFEPGDPDCLRGVDNHPVVWVSWHEALAYCEWLTEKLRGWEETPDPLRSLLCGEDGQPAWRVTLPSEAEWEKAARGTGGRIYPWGDKADPNRANYIDTGTRGISAVGCFPDGKSLFGAEDLSGNVWEWTRSLWGPEFPYPYVPGHERENLEAPDDAPRVLRGGSFSYSLQGVRAANRIRLDPDDRYYFVGFRVVVSPFPS